MNFIKNHKILVLFIVIFIILMVVIGISFKNMFFSENINDKYGNRLNGIEKVHITDSRLQEIKEKLLSNKSINTISYNISGRIIKFFIQVKSETDELSVESMLNVILESFTDEEKGFYDFEVFITNEEEKELYPMIAYKHCNNVTFTITKKVGVENEK